MAPTMNKKNNLPIDVRYEYNRAVEMYQNISHYEYGIIDETEFITKSLEIRDKYTLLQAQISTITSNGVQDKGSANKTA